MKFLGNLFSAIKQAIIAFTSSPPANLADFLARYFEYVSAISGTGLGNSALRVLFHAAIAHAVKLIDASSLANEQKRIAVINAVEMFYERVIVPLDLPLVPPWLESFVDRETKKLIAPAVGGAIDLAVSLLRKAGEI